MVQSTPMPPGGILMPQVGPHKLPRAGYILQDLRVSLMILYGLYTRFPKQRPCHLLSRILPPTRELAPLGLFLVQNQGTLLAMVSRLFPPFDKWGSGGIYREGTACPKRAPEHALGT
jgi:hypothetical protein